MVITASQRTEQDSAGGHRIYEEIELRADKSIAKPEVVSF
ncbi:unnamed protein product [Gongylonema pulchrum]|uniref:Uncharacterized protein n=1 Tax=Gongylonema pulchrum TaxID=637853 RepID=A0A3P6R3R3_9BILA|nr:unnamed protein product [Gongylonema pulchrum]